MRYDHITQLQTEVVVKIEQSTAEQFKGFVATTHGIE